MPKSQTDAGFGQHPGGARLLHRRDQLRHPPAQHDRQVSDRELHPEQHRRLQHGAHRPGHEAEAVGDRGRQRAGRGTAGQRGGTPGNGQASAAGQRRDQLGDVERVTRGTLGQLQHGAVRLAPGQRRDQAGHRLTRQRAQPQPPGLTYHAPQRQQVIALRHRAHHPDQQQRHLPRRPRQPPHKATLAGSAHCRSSTTTTADRTAVCSATSASNCSASAAGTSVPRSAPISPRSSRTIAFRRIRRGLPYSQRVQERHQRQRLAQLVTGTPEHLTAGLPGLRHRRPHQRGLPIPGSPSMSTALPCPRATSFNSPVSIAISLSRPIKIPADVTGDMERTVLPQHLPNKQVVFGH